jgi:hypothetical protein
VRENAGMMRVAPFLAAWLLAVPAFAQIDCNAGMAPIDSAADFPLSAREFIRVIVAGEHNYIKALGSQGYAVDITVETLKGDAVDGVFQRSSVIDFDSSGARRETVAPGGRNTLTRLKLSDKDISVLGDPMSFALTADSFADRDIVYSGRQMYKDRNLALFDVLPRSDKSADHGFSGRTWVRGTESSIVKTCGRDAGYPIGDMRFEVMRAQTVDANYFPVTTRADEEILIDGVPVHIRLTVRYSDYKPR